ncbi:hypothetical protein AGOR_G00071620 [Albula goreensis]|uniref:Interleukin 4/13A n=1 Tax=Albula goreensis TaxID=1534307 RepID=A0A8T3DQ76_9TELE|nr:hypothetical protein AGOR_G00071620 [Albula goreensis]
MKIVLLMSLMLFVSGRAIFSKRQIQLKEIITELNKTKTFPRNITHQQVPDVFNKDKCGLEDFCKAEKITSRFMKREEKISRLLRTYTEGVNCTINWETGNELEMRKLLKHVHDCAQKIYPQHH